MPVCSGQVAAPLTDHRVEFQPCSGEVEVKNTLAAGERRTWGAAVHWARGIKATRDRTGPDSWREPPGGHYLRPRFLRCDMGRGFHS